MNIMQKIFLLILISLFMFTLTACLKVKFIPDQTDQNEFIQLLDSQKSYELPKDAEIHVVTGYRVNDKHYCKVSVDRPGKNVVLLLSSFEDIVWDIEESPNTNISFIVLGGQRYKVKANKQLKVYAEYLMLPSVTKIDSSRFYELLKFIDKKLGRNYIDSIACSDIVPEDVVVNSVNNDKEHLSLNYPILEKVQTNYTFLLETPDEPVKWNLYGPLDKEEKGIYPTASFAMTPDRKTRFKVENNSLLIWDIDKNNVKKIKIPANLPKVDEAESITYSPDNKTVYFTYHRGIDVKLYSYNLTSQKWNLYIPKDPFGSYDSLVYDPYTKHLFAIGYDNEFTLTEYNLNFSPIRIIDLTKSLPGYLRTLSDNKVLYTKNNMTQTPIKKEDLIKKFPGNIKIYENNKVTYLKNDIKGSPIRRLALVTNMPGFIGRICYGSESIFDIIPQKDYLILLTLNAHSNAMQQTGIKMIWVIDKKTGKGYMTYKTKYL